MSIYSGFPMREMENKYNITLFDLLLSLSARVNATIRNRSFDQIRQNHSWCMWKSFIESCNIMKKINDWNLIIRKLLRGLVIVFLNSFKKRTWMIA